MSKGQLFLLIVDSILLAALIGAFISSEKFRKDVINKENKNTGKIFGVMTFSGTIIFALAALLIAVQIIIVIHYNQYKNELCNMLGKERLILKFDGDLDTLLHKKLYPDFDPTNYDSVLINSSRHAVVDTIDNRLLITSHLDPFHLGYVSLTHPGLVNYYREKELSKATTTHTADDKIEQIAIDLFKLRNRYESIDDADPFYKDLNRRDAFNLLQVRQKADQLRSRLKRIDPDALSISHTLLRNYYIAYLDALLAQHENEPEIKKGYIEEGLHTAGTALFRLETILDDQTLEQDPDLLTWIEDNHLKDVLHMIRTWLYAIEALSDGDASKADSAKVNNEYSKITGYYKQQYPLDHNASIRFFLKKE